jgi:hypothetical protein
MGRPPKVITDAQRQQVETLAAYGIPETAIAKVLGISDVTLRKYCRDELDRAIPRANAQVAGFLFTSARRGNVAAQIFWLKTRAGWKEQPAPAPLEVNVNAKVEAKIDADEAFAKLAALLGGAVGAAKGGPDGKG